MTCPLCGKPSATEYRPFCSRGCKQRDLLNWLGDGYVIPGEPLMASNDPEDELFFIPPRQDEDEG